MLTATAISKPFAESVRLNQLFRPPIMIGFAQEGFALERTAIITPHQTCEHSSTNQGDGKCEKQMPICRTDRGSALLYRKKAGALAHYGRAKRSARSNFGAAVARYMQSTITRRVELYDGPNLIDTGRVTTMAPPRAGAFEPRHRRRLRQRWFLFRRSLQIVIW